MYISLLISFAFAIVATRACDPDTPGCDHPGNFTGTLTAFANPAAAYCDPGNQSFVYANIPLSFWNPRDESPCDAPINVTNPSTKKTIEAIVIGQCKACVGDNIQLTTAGLLALSSNGKANKTPAKVKWTFD